MIKKNIRKIRPSWELGRFGGAIRVLENLGWFKVRKDGEEMSQRC